MTICVIGQVLESIAKGVQSGRGDLVAQWFLRITCHKFRKLFGHSIDKVKEWRDREKSET